ncbi:hypothetical protein D3C78_948340 [compost metagenome]
MDNQLGPTPIQCLQACLDPFEIERLARMPAPADAPATVLLLTQANRLCRIRPDRRHLPQAVGYRDVIHTRSRPAPHTRQLTQRQLPLLRPQQRALRQLVDDPLAIALAE